MLTKNYLAIYAKSFNWAGFFLPKKTYEKCSALYDFCREADNIADDENNIEIKKIILLNLEIILLIKIMMIQLLKTCGVLLMNLVFQLKL